MNFSLLELMNGVPGLLPLLGEKTGVRGKKSCEFAGVTN
jgi:hypothetical protein